MTVVCAAAAQPGTQNPSLTPETTFKSTTRVVNVNVVVTDAHGNPITGLTQDDFELLDNGKPQQIRFLDAIQNQPPWAARALPRDIYSNRQPEQGVPPSVTAILFDENDSDWVAQAYALHHLRAFLRKLHPEEGVALYLRADDLKLLHDFTQDSSDLITAIARYDAAHTGPRDQRIKLKANQLSELDRFLAGDDIFFLSHWKAAAQRPGRLGRVMPHDGGMAYPLAHPAVAPVTTLVSIARHLATARAANRSSGSPNGYSSRQSRPATDFD